MDILGKKKVSCTCWTVSLSYTSSYASRQSGQGPGSSQFGEHDYFILGSEKPLLELIFLKLPKVFLEISFAV